MKGIIGIVTVLLLSIGVVSADTGNMDGTMHHDFESGQEFGQHVNMHAKTMGFDGDHNPGVHHRGFSLWAR